MLRIAALILAMLPSMAGASPLAAGYADTVEPSAALVNFLRSLVETAGRGPQAAVYADLDTIIAPDVRGFTRGLDPFEPWSEIDLSPADRRSGVDVLTAWMVEQGDIPQDASILPDYREDFLQLLVALVANPAEPMGHLPEMGKAVCTPARYDVDAGKARAFAQASDTDGTGIHVFPQALELRASPKPGAPVIAQLAPRTLLVTDDQPGQPDNWVKVMTSEGTAGWIEDRGDYEGLSQQHLCFSMVAGEYRIVGFYSYGL